jgi:hypothetical protein
MRNGKTSLSTHETVDLAAELTAILRQKTPGADDAVAVMAVLHFFGMMKFGGKEDGDKLIPMPSTKGLAQRMLKLVDPKVH